MNRCLALLKFLLVCAALAAFASQAQTLPPPLEVAAQWFKIRNASFDQYEVLQSGAAAFEGHYGVSVRRTAADARPGEFGGLVQATRAAPWRGQRVAMRAWIKSEQAESGQLWLRIDAANDYLALDNMDNRPIKGTTGWALYEIVIDVPLQAEYLVYGALLAGGGRMDIDNVQFLPAPVGAKTTNQYKEGYMKLKHGQTYTPPRIVLDVPGNLDFEQLP